MQAAAQSSSTDRESVALSRPKLSRTVNHSSQMPIAGAVTCTMSAAAPCAIIAASSPRRQ